MKTRKLLAVLLALVMVMGMLPAGALGDTPDRSSYSIKAEDVVIEYTAIGEGISKKIGTFEEMTMCGYSGDVYLVSLPYGAEITAIECPRSYGLTNYFGSGDMCLMYCEMNGGNALGTIQEQLIYNEEFSDVQFIEAHKNGYDGYGDLYSWITFDEVLPTNDVKGFAVYDADFYYWAGDGGTVVFIQISTSGGGSGEEPTERTLTIEGIDFYYTATNDGTCEKIGLVTPATGFSGTEADLYILSLPYGSILTGTNASIIRQYGGSDAAIYAPEYGAQYLEFLSVDKYLNDTDFMTAPSGSSFAYGIRTIAITYNDGYTLPTSNVTGCFCEVYEGINIVFYLFIQISTVDSGNTGYSVDKTALAAEIAKVWNGTDYTNTYYKENDRYNGKEYSQNGFWADMLTVLTAAQQVYDDNNATQNKVDTAVANLSAAVEKLIPITQFNATALYEAVNETYYWFNGVPTPSSQFTGTINNLDKVSAYTCSPSSWSVYQASLEAANTELGILFDENGHATVYNVRGGEHETEYDSVLTALNEAFAGLDELGGEFDLANAQFAYKQLEVLSRRVMPVVSLNEEDYSSSSWAAFEAASEAAAEFLASHSTPQAPIGRNEAVEYYQILSEYWNAAFSLEAANEGTAVISVVDTYAARKGTAPSTYAGTHTVSIPSGGMLLHDALKQLLGDDYRFVFDNLGLGYGVYINGVYVMMARGVNTSPNSTGFNNIRLKDGDRVVIALMLLPTYANLSGGLTFYKFKEIHDALKYISFSQNGIPTDEAEGVSGEEIILSAGYSYASLMDYSGSNEPLNGAKVYISSACSTRQEAMDASATIDTGIVTGSNGSFSISLYSGNGSGEGWYALNVLSTDEYGGLANGANLIVHVTDPSDLSELKVKLKAELEEVYTAYEEGFYTAEQLETVTSLYNAGIEGIGSASYSGDAEEAFRTAYDGITSIQESNEEALSINLIAVRYLLGMLPSAEDFAAGKLYYEDKAFLDLLFAPDGWYTRMTEYQKAQFTASETELLEAMRNAWIDSDGGEELPSLPVYTVKVETRDIDTGELLDLPIAFNTSSTHAISFAGWNVNSETGVLQISGTSLLELTFDPDTGTFTLPGGTWYQIRLYPYVTSDNLQGYVRVEGSRGYVTDIDFHYRVDKEHGDDNLDYYYTIRKDATITLYYRLADAVSEARKTALVELERAFQNYDRTGYTDENWQVLSDAYRNGREAVTEALTADDVDSAKNAALAAMAAVSRRPAGEYGTVYVTVRNDTYPVSEGAPWEGALIDRVPVELTADSTMMSCIVEALGSYTIIGAETNYVSSINGLAEFDGGRQSGWMGTKNDWFVNEGFASFSVANGNLNDGDVICIEYTCAFGADIHGGTETNRDTSLWKLSFTGGTLSPAFDGTVTNYILTLDAGANETTIEFTSNNRSFQSRAYLNSYAPNAKNWIRSGDSVKVGGGDVIYVGVGEGAWPAMGTGIPTRYVITIVSPDEAAAVEELIRAIGSITYSNYADKKAAASMARDAYEALTEDARAEVSNYDVLTAAESAIAGFEDVDELKEDLASLPNDMTKVSRGDLEKIKDDYEYLTDAQKALLTVAEQAKVERVIAALEGIIIEETALEKLSQDVSAIEWADWSVDQASANGAAALKSYIEEKLAAMSLSGTPVVDTVSVEPAVSGDATDPDGTDGSYSFTVTLSLDGVSQSVTVNDAVIKATEYIAPVDYEPVLKAVEEYLAEKVTDPAVASVGGEWAVFALNRGGVADSSWNYKYIENLKDYVDDCGGRLHDRKYTEYSRVVLALTSMGVDPTQFATDSGTYDLVSPLLDKQNDTEYWAEWQGNNGTAFALLALDSHRYLNNEAGNAARARFIESLKAKQLEGGGWNIDSGAADLDTTAAVIYALAPYYLDSTKLDALNCSVSHDELKAMVDSALEFLSGRQNTSGGYGSAEADCWTIIALSSLGRDANSDAAFVKNGHTLLSDLLSYYDEATGAFRHLSSGSVDGMATEQAAYTLVAYDRFMKGQNTLYDMSDVTFRSGLSMAEELIDSITEPVSLADEDKIEAARAAYDALSDEEKASLDPGKIIKLEAAEKALSDLKVAKAEELIDAIGSPVRLSDENAIGKARNYYNNELSDAERARVGNYDKLTSAESALQKLKSETPQGQTKAVTVTINGVTYEVSEATKKAVEAMQAITDTTDPAEKLPEDFRDLTPEKEKQILDAYSLYKALTPDEKLFATNYDDFYKNVLLKLGESYHYDERTDTDARDNDDDILPWYVKMSVEDGLLTDKQKEDLASVLGEDFTERAVYRISFTDAFTGEAFEPDELISLSFPADGLDPSRTPVFVFVRDDGSFEFIDGRTVDGRLVMQATDFGTCAVTDSSYTWDEILSGGPAEPEEARSRSWALPAGIGIALLVIAGIVILIMRRRREDEE